MKITRKQFEKMKKLWKDYNKTELTEDKAIDLGPIVFVDPKDADPIFFMPLAHKDRSLTFRIAVTGEANS